MRDENQRLQRIPVVRLTDEKRLQLVLRYAYEVAGGAKEGAELLLNAASVACHGIRVDIEEAVATITDNMTLCAEVEDEAPRAS